jgi:hypothetical protein
VLAAIVIFVGLGLPLACYFRKGWCAQNTHTRRESTPPLTVPLTFGCCFLPHPSACWEARREAAERNAKADHGRWTAEGGTTASWIQHRLKSLGADVAPASSGVEMRQAKVAKAPAAQRSGDEATTAPAAAPGAAAPKRWGRGAKAAPVMEVEAPVDEEMGGAAGAAAPPPERRGLMGRFGRGKPQAAAGRIEETPVHDAAPSTVYTEGDDTSFGDEDFTESEFTESRVSGRR